MGKAAMLLSNSYIMVCEFDEKGYAIGLDEHKLLPAAGEYDAQVESQSVRVTIGYDRTLRVEPIIRGKVMLEFK
jgi:hypothetical protein